MTEHEKLKLYNQSLAFLRDKLFDRRYSALKIGIQYVPVCEEDYKACDCSECPVHLPACKEPRDFDRVGRVIDFCRVISEKHRLHNEDSFDNYLSNYMKRFDKTEILLFRLAENPDFDAVFEYCMKHHRSLPVALEVGGNDHKEAARRFESIMIQRSRLHTRPKFKDEITKNDQELFHFFDNLYQAFTCDTETEADIGKLFDAADKIRNYILENYKSSSKYPLGFDPKKQQLDIHRFQIQVYIYYMQYMHVANYLLDYYKDMLNDFDFTIMLKNYMFHDVLEELKFDGLVGYFNIPWLLTKKEVTLYHFYDGYEGETVSYGTFKKEITRCMEHIVCPQQGNGSEVISFSKAFGRCALKYYAPPRPDLNYNIRIVRTPVNCFYNGKCWIPLQAVLRTDSFMNREQNFIIDFSEYYFGRGDGVPEASFLELYKKATGKNDMKRESVASIYDQEVHIKNTNGIGWHDYSLDLKEMLILLILYKYLRFSKEHTVHDLQIPAKAGQYQDIREILSQIDFEQERKFDPDSRKHNCYFENEYISEKKQFEKGRFHKIYDYLPRDINDYEKAGDWIDQHSIKEYQHNDN